MPKSAPIWCGKCMKKHSNGCPNSRRGWNAKHRGTAEQRGYGRYWKRLRTQMLTRDNNTCKQCGDKATHVDHILNKARGGTDSPNNLQSLCFKCHKAKTATESRYSL